MRDQPKAPTRRSIKTLTAGASGNRKERQKLQNPDKKQGYAREFNMKVLIWKVTKEDRSWMVCWEDVATLLLIYKLMDFC